MIEITALSKTYNKGKPNEVRALKDVSFSISDTGLDVILGKSGSGKSTLLHLLGGVDFPSEGTVKYNGDDIFYHDAKRLEGYRRDTVSFVFQKNNLIPHLTVLQNFLVSGLSEENASKALEEVGLLGFEKKKCSELSGGEEQRVAIARAIARQSPILLCDEPTGSLDEENSALIFGLLKRVSEKSSVIVVTHDQHLADTFADVIIKMVDGRIIERKIINESIGALQEALPKRKKIMFFTKLGLLFSSLKKKSVRSVLAALSIGLMMTSVSLPLSHVFEDRHARFLSFACNDSYVSFSYAGDFEPGDLLIEGDISNFMLEEFQLIQSKYPNSFPIYGLTRTYKGQEISLRYNQYFSSQSREEAAFISEDDRLLGQGADAVVRYEKSLESHFPLLSGKYPTSGDEIAIPKFAADLFLKYGFQANFSSEPLSFSDYDELINGSLECDLYSGSHRGKIVGVIDTGMNLSSYPNGIAFNGNGTMLDNIQHNRFTEDYLFSKICALMASPELTDSIFGSQDSYDLGSGIAPCLKLDKPDSQFRFIKRNQAEFIPFENEAKGTFLSLQDFTDYCADIEFDSTLFQSKDYRKCMNYFTDFSSVPTNSDYLFAKKIFAYPSYAMGDPSASEASNLALLSCGNYVSQHGLMEGESKDRFKAVAQSYYDSAFRAGQIEKTIDFSIDSEENEGYLQSFYVKYLASHQGRVNGYYTNPYGEKSGEDIVKEFVQCVLGPTLLENRKMVKILSTPYPRRQASVTTEFVVPIAGICMGFNGPNDTIGFSSDYFDVFARNHRCLANVHTLYVPNGLSNDDIRYLDEFAVSHKMALENSSIAVYRTFGNIFWSGANIVSLIFGAAFLILGIALQLLILLSSAHGRKRELFLRYTLGSSKPEISFALASECAVASLIGALFSIPLTVALSSVLNHVLSSFAGFPIAIFSPNPLSWLLVFVFVEALVYAISFLLSMRLSKVSLSNSLKEE